MNDVVTFAWWNTGIAPLGKQRPEYREMRQTASDVVASLIEDWGVDLIAVGEVTTEDLDPITPSNAFKSLDATEKIGRLFFDTALIYRSARIDVLGFGSVKGVSANSNFKVASKVKISIDGDQFFILVSHWPSRILREQDVTRRRCGERLRQAVEEELDSEYVVLLGDYNDEPFDPSLTEGLEATPDKLRVLRQPKLIYNPFWAQLGSRSPHPEFSADSDISGSHFTKSGPNIRDWFLYDQIMFSSAFLRPGGWQLDEAGTGIVNQSDLRRLVLSQSHGDKKFDHLPVVGRIVRENS